MIRVRRLVPLLLAAAVLAAACSGAESGGAGAPAADTTLDVRLVLEPTSLDITSVAGAAVSQLLLDNVYEGLLTRDAGGAIVPLLAQDVSTSPDGLTYTFRLHDGLTFADGSPLMSADVVWSYRNVIAPESKNPNKADFAAVTGVDAPDPHTVVITLSRRDANFTYALTDRAAAVLKQGTDPATLAGTANGSGPFVIRSWQRGSSITLARNEHYWGQPANLSGVVLHYIPDTTAANNAQLTGETDVETGPDPTLLSQFQGPDFTVAEGVTSDKFVLGINNGRGPLADVRVRHAIRQAIDKDGLIRVALAGKGQRIGSGVAPTDPWFDAGLTSIDPYDPPAAKALLAEAGFGSGLDLTLVVPNIYSARIGEYVASQLGQVGIRVRYEPVEFATWLDRVYTKADYDLSIVDHAEARDIGNYANPDYYWRYSDAQVQQWADQASTAASDAERDGLYRQVARKISEDAVSDWLYSPTSLVVLRAGVTGFPTRETNSRLDLAQVTASAAQ
ncbi:ABC transporter substrate-binding protein [Pseudonocardia xinjiangensis]|uniref:ABC transporter substrate-binding protein n=1 Tax=Pseudonocardia xinjiangensis TaxID=75289 RepID=UPI003D94FDD1